MDSTGFQRKKSTAFVTRSTIIVWSWSQKRKGKLKIKKYFSLVYKELVLLMLSKKKKVN